MSTTRVISKDEFTELVMKAVAEESISYMEASANLVEEMCIEPEDVKALISKPLMAKIEAEASTLNMLREKNKTKRLF